MPIYEYRCPEHGTHEQIRPYSDSDLEAVPCVRCGAPSERLIEVPCMHPDDFWMGRESITLGKSFDSKSEMKRYCKQKGIEPGGGIKDYGAASRAAGVERERAARHKKVREESIGQTVRDLII